MTSPDLDAQKQRLRQELLAARRVRGPVDAARSQAAQGRLIASGLLDGAACVALYRALPSEIATDALLSWLEERGFSACFPVVQEGARTLAFHRAGQGFARDRLGIQTPRDPSAQSEVPLASIDAFVVPSLALDLHGNRLGRGRAHYDSTLLAHPSALRIGLGCEWALVPAVPVGEHDAPLDALCTEDRLLLCTERARAAAAHAAPGLHAGRTETPLT